MSDFGVTEAGFTLKGFDLILSESATRARQMFGADVDLSSTSPLRKILETTAMEDAELWKSMEDLYYSGFVSTATGASLDLLGEDLGLARRPLFAAGTAQFTLTGAAPGRQYIAPEGTIIETAPPSPAPSLAFFTLAPVVLSAAAPKAVVPAQAFLRGAGGNIGAGDLARVNPAYQVAELNFGGAALTVTNPQPFSGGETQEDDETYRARMLGYPRSIWTLESIRRAVLDVDGVIDVLLNDALGGVDASQSFFNLFSFNRRVFSRERQWSEPPYFDIVIAHEFGRPWGRGGRRRGDLRSGAASGGRNAACGGSSQHRRGGPYRGRASGRFDYRIGRGRAGDSRRRKTAACARPRRPAFGQRRAVFPRDGGPCGAARRARCAKPAPAPLRRRLRAHHVRGRAVSAEPAGVRARRKPCDGANGNRSVSRRQPLKFAGGHFAMIFAATQMANRLTVPFAPGADSLLLTLTDAAPGAALVSAYDFQEHTARYDHIPQPRYVVQALRDSAQAVTLAIDYDAAGIAGMQTAVLTIPAGTLAGESFALDLGGRDAVSQITGLTQTPPDGSAAQNWAVFALLGQTAKLLWTLGRERDQIRARQAKAREQRRLGAALGQSLDWIGADLGIPRFPPLPYGFDPQTIALYHLDDSPGSGQAEVAAAADAMQGYGLPGHPASNPGAAGQTARSGAAGRFSSGFAFRSDSARLEAASSPDFDFAAADSFTLECFVRPDSDTGAGPLLSRCANSSDPAKPGYALETGDFGRGPVRSVRFLASDGTRQIALFLDDTLPTDRFSHLAAVIDRDRGEARLSLDGAQRAAAPLKNLGAISNAEPLRMGGGPFRGTLDEVRLSRAAYAQFAPALGEGDAMYRQRLEIFRRWTLPTAASLQQAVNAVSGPIGGDAEPILINDAPPTQHSDTLPITILPWNMPMGQSLNAQGNPKAREADVCGILADGPAFDPAFCVTFADPQCVSDPPPARVLHPGEPAPDAAKMRAGTANRLRSLLALLNRNFGGGILHILSAFDPRADDLRAAGRGLWLRHDFGGSGFLGALALQAGFEWVQTASDPNDIYSDEIYVSSPPGEDLEINLTPQDAAFDALVGQALTVSFSPSLPRGDAAQWQVISCGAAQAALAAGSNPSSMNLLASAPGLLTLRAEVMHNGQRYVGSRTLQIGIGSLPDGASPCRRRQPRRHARHGGRARPGFSPGLSAHSGFARRRVF